MREDGRSINWTCLQMEGRTTKSLQNQWTKIVKEITDMESGEGGLAATPPRAKATRK